MPTRWDYVLELRPPTKRSTFQPQVIYENGEPWWSGVNKGKLMIHPPELSGNPTSSQLVAKQEELG
jgi:hypothetical protein